MEENTVEEYLNSWFSNRQTRYQYKSHLKLYFEFLGTNPFHYFDKNEKENYFRDYKKDVLKYWQHMNEKYSPKSIPPHKSTIKGFLEENDIDLPNKFWKNLTRRGKGTEPVREDRAPTINELQQILNHCSNALERAFFLMMASSGIRPEELCRLTIKKVDFDGCPVKIRIPANISKNKKRRVTFISNEAEGAVLEWLKVRNKHIKIKLRKTRGLQKYLKEQYNAKIYGDEADRLFPYTTNTMRGKWNKLLERSGFIERDGATGDYTLHLYTLRKFFETRISKVVPEPYVKYMMGHSGYMNDVYRKYNDNLEIQKEIGEEYVKGMHRLQIYEIPANQDEIDKMKDQLDQLQEQMLSLLEFQKRTTSTQIETENGALIEMQENIPNDVILKAYNDEKERKKKSRIHRRKVISDDVNIK